MTEQLTRAQRRKLLRELYARVPKVQCKGMCSESCTMIDCSKTEQETIEKRAGKKLNTRPHHSDPIGYCSMLSPAGRCTVYGDRPMVCRLWGAVPEMPCPHGCEVIGEPLKRDEGMELMIRSMFAGGGRGYTHDVDLAEMLRLIETPAFKQIYEQLTSRGRAGDEKRMGGSIYR